MNRIKDLHELHLGFLVAACWQSLQDTSPVNSTSRIPGLRLAVQLACATLITLDHMSHDNRTKPSHSPLPGGSCLWDLPLVWPVGNRILGLPPRLTWPKKYFLLPWQVLPPVSCSRRGAMLTLCFFPCWPGEFGLLYPAGVGPVERVVTAEWEEITQWL